MKCQATISTEEARVAGHDVGSLGRGFDARDAAAHWCEEEGSELIRLSFGDRTVNVYVCAAHCAEYIRLMEAA